MAYVWTIIKGMMMGIANIIPGVSGGTMAVSLGIYDELISSITHLAKNWKKSMKFLIPLGIGLVGGIAFFSYLIEMLLDSYTLPTALAFVGLILGGLPILWRSFSDALKEKREGISVKHVIVFLLFFALVIGMALMQETEASTAALELNVGNMLVLFLVGIVASATMVVPGISGSLVLMVLGYYFSILSAVNGFIEALRTLNIEELMYTAGLLIPFGIGVLLGIFLISRLIEYLFESRPGLTYSGILGLVLASPFAIVHNTNALADLSGSNAVMFTIIGLILAALCFYLTYTLGKTEDPQEVEEV